MTCHHSYLFWGYIEIISGSLIQLWISVLQTVSQHSYESEVMTNGLYAPTMSQDKMISQFMSARFACTFNFHDNNKIKFESISLPNPKVCDHVHWTKQRRCNFFSNYVCLLKHQATLLPEVKQCHGVHIGLPDLPFNRWYTYVSSFLSSGGNRSDRWAHFTDGIISSSIYTSGELNNAQRTGDVISPLDVTYQYSVFLLLRYQVSF
jgi:hypothetical protein